MRAPLDGFGYLLWIIAYVLLLALFLSACKRPEIEAAEAIESSKRGGDSFTIHTDPMTGCEYLRYSGLTPRIDADGKTHLGCRWAAK